MLRLKSFLAPVSTIALVSACATGWSEATHADDDDGGAAGASAGAGSGQAGAAGAADDATSGLPGSRDDAEIIAADFAAPLATAVGADVPEDFSLRAEAEDGEIGGQSTLVLDDASSGGAYVLLRDGWDRDLGETASYIEWEVDVEAEGIYSLVVIGSVDVDSGHKENSLIVNGTRTAVIKSEESETHYEHAPLMVDLSAGANVIRIEGYWGWTNIDAVELRAADSSYLDVAAELVTPKPSENARRLIHYLTRQFGRATLSGQQELSWSEDVYDLTGKYPAILGVDFIDFSGSRIERQGEASNPGPTQDALEWWKDYGGIVTALWHWNAPTDLINDSEHPWYQGFYSENTTFDLAEALSDEDSERYQLLVEDIDRVAMELKKLDDAGVPILWRPLHEASGGWFWWGAAGADAYLELWNLLFDRLTNHHGLKNLIWVWNGQHADWYPGDDTVDIVSEDIYAGDRDYSPQLGAFGAAMQYSDSPKLIALSENGTLLDPELQEESAVAWSWFCVWSGADYVTSETKNEHSMLSKVYDSDFIVSLDELPLIKNYPLPGETP